MKDISALSDAVMTGRMNGPALDADERATSRAGSSRSGAPRADGPRLPAVARGQALFTNSTTGCASCHSGPRFHDSLTLDVGTGGKIPGAVAVGSAPRAPFLHDGCATTLTDRSGLRRREPRRHVEAVAATSATWSRTCRRSDERRRTGSAPRPCYARWMRRERRVRGAALLAALAALAACAGRAGRCAPRTWKWRERAVLARRAP